MNVRKFTASSSREAWHMVREALGADAVILSNRRVGNRTEILALAADDMASLAAPVVEKRPLSPHTLSALMPRQDKPAITFAPPAPAAPPKPAAKPAAAAPSVAPAATAPSAASGAERSELDSLMKEIRSMRGMLETQLAELTWGDRQKKEPARASVLREMLAAGFSASLSRYMTERMPSGLSHKRGMDWVKSVLERNLTTIGNENEILEKGGVYALVGPTGVGKTTTTAKLAARCVMRHGPGKLALITTDGYRIGGYEQLRIYGKILGVMVHSVKDEADLRIALEELKGKHTILIDTVGVGQRDQMVAEQIAMLSGSGTEIKRLLCLNATSNGETLNEVARNYMGDGLAGCILTKLDEAATIGNAVDVAIRQKLNLYYVANGQRVPEDLHVANKAYLVDRAFKLKRETAPFQFSDEEIPLVMANTARAMNDKSLREVMLG
ncbi:flagellar biosynthesis regulator FlhF [Oxalicibacterium flavum]|uniref:Flagellar biosynthesis protein FlhF n=1 Tax=Oxalicibacterium flavum TaxID=179467 RepID=A0A8J2UQ46_9BURK|nr:flagellar biosynthesis protein FlhF [Oxalicibacterium flavum]GGC04012.1 flagellar biosynthesis regulator FlhF [Oxalicibacterium flavum]